MISSNKNIIPFFSVVITTFNRANLVKNALNTVLNQTEKDYEIIIVDDGSTDDTFDLIKDNIKQYSNIKYIYHKNRGPALSKNAGIIASSGIYVTFLDSDDLYLNNHLEIRKEIIFEYPEIDLFHGGVEIIGDEFVPDKNDINKKININNCIIGGTFFVKRDILISVKGFPDVKYSEDNLLYQKIKNNGYKIAKINEPTYIYNRNNEQSICNQI